MNVERRLFSFSFGNQEARINWVHVDNLVMAHILAADGLTPSKGYVAVRVPSTSALSQAELDTWSTAGELHCQQAK